MEVCRLRDTPILTFINKLDREIRDPIEVLDEIEDILQIQCAPMNWPIGWGSISRASTTSTGTDHLLSSRVTDITLYPYATIAGLDSDAARAYLA